MNERLYREVGLICGLEIHQMLDTKAKLFCKCKSIVRSDEPHFSFIRRLRPTRSELGEMDPAALFEFKKGFKFRYEGYYDSTCLVEMDEEPPHPLNMEALEIALEIALLLNSEPVDEVHVMRKIVIDGSNTTGFQRTALIALGGYIDVNNKRIPIQTICLEEDAARKIEVRKKTKEIVYRLDRLGIPLIEIATAPVITTPKEAELVAFRIGQLLRITGKVKRGLGTIRQDLNISIKDGARVEIKGVQLLNLIPKIVEYEVQRQINLLKIRDELKSRGLRKDEIKLDIFDVTEILRNSKSKIIKKALKIGGVVLALKLPKFAGLIGREIQPGRRLGTEFSERAKYWGDVGGIFHSDELPAYGISEEEVLQISKVLNCSDLDAFVLVADEKEKAEKALKAVYERAIEALEGVPNETRGANSDGTTSFLRPMPGKARMYPETDIRPIEISRELIEKIKKHLPEKPEEKYEKFIKKYGLSKELAQKMVNSYHINIFEKIVEEIKAPPTLVATTLENTIISLRRDGFNVDNIEDRHLIEIFKLYVKGKIVKDAIPEILKVVCNEPDLSIEEIVKKHNLEKLEYQELVRIVNEIINHNIDVIMKQKQKSIGYIMSLVMKKLRGRVEGRDVNTLIRERIKLILEGKIY